MSSLPFNEDAETNLEISRLSKVFRVYDSSRDRLKQINPFSNKTYYHDFKVLDDINFSVKRGECLGIVGKNGSGKSTLLKIISNTLRATEGQVKMKGRCFALLELGTGLNEDLTGIQNITHMANMLDLDREWVESRKDDIIEFSGLGDFIHRPVRTYSSGMTLRLSFSLFASLDPDILIIDEALAVGDTSFQLKCMRRIEEMIYVHKKSIILVTHDMNALEKFSDRVLWLDEGKVRTIGDASDVITEYIMQNSTKKKIEEPSPPLQQRSNIEQLQLSETAVIYSSDIAEITNVRVESVKEQQSKNDLAGHVLDLCVEVNFNKLVVDPVIGLRLINKDGDVLVSSNTIMENIKLDTIKAGSCVKLRWPIPNNLVSGDYFVTCGVTREESTDFITRHIDAYKFTISGQSNSAGLLNLREKPTVVVI